MRRSDQQAPRHWKISLLSLPWLTPLSPTQEEAVAEMNRWRNISYGVVPLVFGLTAYTLSTASHSHADEKIVRGPAGRAGRWRATGTLTLGARSEN